MVGWVLFEVAVVVVGEAGEVVAVAGMAFKQFAVLLCAKGLINLLCSLELLACRADREDIVLSAVDNKELARCHQACDIAHITEF